MNSGPFFIKLRTVNTVKDIPNKEGLEASLIGNEDKFVPVLVWIPVKIQ
jgi:hypothetical protein